MPLKDLSPLDAARLSSLLDRTLDLDPLLRAAWLADLSAREPHTGAQIKDLLAALEQGNADPLETRELVRHRQAAALRTQVPAAQSSLEGRHFGPYRVLKLLGEGGMGTVWLAERADGLFDRQVALKLVRHSASGPALAERFARERTILAALDHPHIARMLDAGVAADGQPYLAIDYVEGQALTSYCDEKRLPVAARVDLLVQVLSAVQYAHRNLVIHRDLKPNNILVTSAGQVRLLDFGIAKLMTEGEAKETELTDIAGRALTPDYASPEQISGAPITTASDVYSLGVLLYALLCGNRPYGLKRASRGAFEEAILHSDPARPSQSASTDEIANARATSAKKLRHALAGDLDTIALKALKKNPAERYATADAFMQDLQRFAAGKPVLARPDSAAYRLRKFVVRHRIGSAAAAAFALLLSVGVALVVWQAKVATREARTARAVEDFLLQIFQSNSRDQKDPLKAQQTSARQLLDLGNRELKGKLDDVPDAKQEILAVMAKMYYELGLNEEAVELNRQRVEVVRAVSGPRSSETAYALVDYAQALYQKGDFPKLEPALIEAKSALDKIHDTSSQQRVSLLAVMASFLGDSSPEKAILYAQEAVAICKSRYPGTRDLGDSLNILARARYDLGEYDVAEQLQREALATFVALPANDTLIATSRILLAGMQMKVLKITDAEQNFRTALDAMRKANGDSHVYTLHARFRLGRFLHATGRRAEGLALMQSALATAQRTLPGDDAGTTPQFLGATGSALLAEGRVAEATPDLERALRSRQEHFPGGELHAIALEAMVELLTTKGEFAEAQRLLASAVALRIKIGGPAAKGALAMDEIRHGNIALARGDAATAGWDFKAALQVIEDSPRGLLLDGGALAKLGLAAAAERQGDFAQAQWQASGVLDALRAATVRDNFMPLEAAALLQVGVASHAAGDVKAARTTLEAALRLLETLDSQRSPSLEEAEIALADCLLDLGERNHASSLLKRAKAIRDANPDLGEQFTSPLHTVSAKLGAR